MLKYQNLQSDEQFLEWKNNTALIPYLFTYNGTEYNGFPFTRKSERNERTDEKETATIIFAVDESLEITLVLTHYFDYGATEFTVWFENVGEKNCGVLENMRVSANFKGDNPILRGILGDHENYYEPYARKLTVEYFRSENGRATHIFFPYFNLEYGDGGVMLAIGWSGRWCAMFRKTDEGALYVARYAMNLHTYLKPHEKIRSPLFLFARYSVRNENYATNFWRSWFLKYNLPKADAAGGELKPFSTCHLAGDTGKPNCDGSVSETSETAMRSLRKLVEEKINIDFRWFDAGWYVDSSGKSRSDDWSMVGTWEADREKWGEKGIAESVEYARNNGIKTLLWFEPERVTMVDGLVKNYGYKSEWAYPQYENEKETPWYEQYILNNFANGECYEWTKERVFKVLTDNKIDLYREDFNRDPAMGWLAADFCEDEPKNRRGINECKAVDRHYKFFEEVTNLTASYGGCAFADSCASGGGRNDLQTLRYSVPLNRSDSDRASIALRLSMTSALSKWIPFNGACNQERDLGSEQLLDGKTDAYVWRASYLPIMNTSGRFTQNPDFDFDDYRRGLSEWKRVSRFLLKDFYLLTPWQKRSNKDCFTAHCYFDDVDGEGVLLAFRMEKCEKNELTLCLPFLKKDEYCILRDEDTTEEIKTLDENVRLVFTHTRQARLIWIKREKRI